MAFFQKIKEAFIKNEDKDKYLSGLDRSKKSFGDRLRALSNNFHGINDELLEIDPSEYNGGSETLKITQVK